MKSKKVVGKCAECIYYQNSNPRSKFPINCLNEQSKSMNPDKNDVCNLFVKRTKFKYLDKK